MFSENIRMLQQEFESMKRIDHPFVIKVVEKYHDKDQYVHLVIEYMPEGDLSRYISEKQF